jgi:hypothetical protein
MHLIIGLALVWIIGVSLTTASLPAYNEAVQALSSYPVLAQLLPNPLAEFLYQFGLPTAVTALGAMTADA